MNNPADQNNDDDLGMQSFDGVIAHQTLAPETPTGGCGSSTPDQPDHKVRLARVVRRARLGRAGCRGLSDQQGRGDKLAQLVQRAQPGVLA